MRPKPTPWRIELGRAARGLPLASNPGSLDAVFLGHKAVPSMDFLTRISFNSYWSAPEVTVNVVVFMNIVGALLLGLVVGYERTYHGRAAGMRTYGLVCMASAALTVLAG
jgi:hypothetical protein